MNTEKTKILQTCEDSQFLGFAFTQKMKARKKKEFPTQRFFSVVHKKRRVKLVESLKTILDRRAKGGVEIVKRKLLLKLRDWCNYFKDAVPEKWKQETDTWIRRKIRQLLWKQWKKPGKRCEELSKPLSINACAFSSNRYWYMSKSHDIHRALGNSRMERERWTWISVFES